MPSEPQVDERSFGRWTVIAARPKSLIAGVAVVEVRLRSTGLVLTDWAGRTIGPWPFERVEFDVTGPSSGRLRLGATAVVVIQSLDQRSAVELRTAIHETWQPPEPVERPEARVETTARVLLWQAPEAQTSSAASVDRWEFWLAFGIFSIVETILALSEANAFCDFSDPHWAFVALGVGFVGFVLAVIGSPKGSKRRAVGVGLGAGVLVGFVIFLLTGEPYLWCSV